MEFDNVTEFGNLPLLNLTTLLYLLALTFLNSAAIALIFTLGMCFSDRLSSLGVIYGTAPHETFCPSIWNSVQANFFNRGLKTTPLKKETNFIFLFYCFLLNFIFDRYRSSSKEYEMSYYLPWISNISSRPEVFCKKGVFKNFAKFTGKHLCQSLFFYKVSGLRLKLFKKRGSGTGVFLWIMQNFYKLLFYTTPLVAASEHGVIILN